MNENEMTQYFVPKSKIKRIYAVEPLIGGDRHAIFYHTLRADGSRRSGTRAKTPCLYQQVGDRMTVQAFLDSYARLMGWKAVEGAE